MVLLSKFKVYNMNASTLSSIKNQKDFEKSFARDQLKKELCDKNRILLIEIWYYEDPYIMIPRKLKELDLIS